MDWSGSPDSRAFWRLPAVRYFRLIPDYVFPGISNQALATILAGIVGALMVFGVALGVAYLRRNGKATA